MDGGLPWGVNRTPRKTSLLAAVASTLTTALELVSVMAIRRLLKDSVVVA